MLNDANDIIWENKTPSSVLFCRPLFFEFVKETENIVKKIYNHYNSRLDKLQTHNINIGDKTFKCSFDFECTMIDGKVCSILTGERASSRCNICHVGPSKVNDIEYVLTLLPDEQSYKFGLSTLHAWIRCLEYLLHIAYNMGIETSTARSDEEKKSKAQRKQMIQTLLSSKLGITVDVVKQGWGTTNTGNVARAFFENAKSVAEITQLDENLINRLHNVLQVITSGKAVDCNAFQTYSLDTARLCIQLYPWYNIPPAVHKILIHGSDIIKALPLPIGWYSEECQEANNKHFRQARLLCSRMFNRTASNEDVLHYMLIASDPFVSRNRYIESRKVKKLSDAAKNMLVM